MDIIIRNSSMGFVSEEALIEMKGIVSWLLTVEILHWKTGT